MSHLEAGTLPEPNTSSSSATGTALELQPFKTAEEYFQSNRTIQSQTVSSPHHSNSPYSSFIEGIPVNTEDTIMNTVPDTDEEKSGDTNNGINKTKMNQVISNLSNNNHNNTTSNPSPQQQLSVNMTMPQRGRGRRRGGFRGGSFARPYRPRFTRGRGKIRRPRGPQRHTISKSGVVSEDFKRVYKVPPRIKQSDRYQDFVRARNECGYNFDDFKITDDLEYIYNIYIEKFPLHLHINDYRIFVDQKEKQQQCINHNGTSIPPRWIVKHPRLAEIAPDNDKLQSHFLQWMRNDPSNQLKYFKFGQFDILRPNDRTIVYQCHDSSNFEDKADIDLINAKLNKGALFLNGEVVESQAFGRRTVFDEFDAVIFNLDPKINTNENLRRCLPIRLRDDRRSGLIYWMIQQWTANDGNPVGINVLDYITSDSGLNIDIFHDLDRTEFITRSSDITENVSKEQVLSYCRDMLELYNDNPTIPLWYPQWFAKGKCEALLEYILPDDMVKTTNKDYASILSTAPLNTDSPTLSQTVITFHNVYPPFILGGGPNLLPVPSPIIAGRIHQLLEYHGDITAEYIKFRVRRCYNCCFPGVTRPDCERCNIEEAALKEKIKRELTQNNAEIPVIRKALYEAKIEYICRKCSVKGDHKEKQCLNQFFCMLDALPHKVGDRQQCEVYKSIGGLLINAKVILDSGTKINNWTNWDILNNNLKSTAAKPLPLPMNDTDMIDVNEVQSAQNVIIPSSLQQSIPRIPSNTNDPNDTTNIHQSPPVSTILVSGQQQQSEIIRLPIDNNVNVHHTNDDNATDNNANNDDRTIQTLTQASTPDNSNSNPVSDVVAITTPPLNENGQFDDDDVDLKDPLQSSSGSPHLSAEPTHSSPLTLTVPMPNMHNQSRNPRPTPQQINVPITTMINTSNPVRNSRRTRTRNDNQKRGPKPQPKAPKKPPPPRSSSQSSRRKSKRKVSRSRSRSQNPNNRNTRKTRKDPNSSDDASMDETEEL